MDNITKLISWVKDATRTPWYLLGTIVLFVMPDTSAQESLISRLEVFHLETGSREVVLQERGHFEAPNWSLDGSYLLINQNGLLYKYDFASKAKIPFHSGPLQHLNNDHGISADGKLLAISNNDPDLPSETGTSRIYVMPLSGGEPELLTPLYPSYWHGWSPDGELIVYTALRGDDYDIYSMALKDGREIRLTSESGLDDGPEFSVDGEHIYYNSIHSGSMQIWRMRADGSEKVQLTEDSYSNWFPHPSPDGRFLVFLSYLKDQGDRHPAMKKVALRLYDLESGKISTLCSFTGGQGSINVPSWSSDSRKFAFVSYELIPDKNE